MTQQELLIANAVEFVEGERGVVSITTAASQLFLLGKHSGGVWPEASQEQWCDAIHAAGKQGHLLVDGNQVRLPPPQKAEKKGDTESQGSLF